MRGLTDARKRALLVLAEAVARGVDVRVSNETAMPTPTRSGRVYWQTADWLISEQLVTHSFHGGETLTLTDAGAVLATGLRVGVKAVTS